MEELEDKLSEMEQPCSSLINTTPCMTTASLGKRSKNTKGNHSKKKSGKKTKCNVLVIMGCVLYLLTYHAG